MGNKHRLIHIENDYRIQWQHTQIYKDNNVCMCMRE